MLDLIYIIDETLRSPDAVAEYTPNFTIPVPKNASASKAALGGNSVVNTAARMAVVGLNPFSLPTTLIASAVLGTPSLISMITKDRKEKAEELELVKAEEARLLAEYVTHHSMSPSQAKKSGYKFQPGHPVVGKTYRRHPLNDYAGAELENLYIPGDCYDAILLEERESELIKLLVHLGATRITITKKNQAQARHSVTAGATVQVGPVAGGGANYSAANQRDNESLDTREFCLNGRSWTADTRVVKERFCWLPYEPSWKAVVFAREEGGCLTASLEIKENTSFSIDKNLELSVKAKQVELEARVGMTSTESEERTYFVRAEFSPVQ